MQITPWRFRTQCQGNGIGSALFYSPCNLFSRLISLMCLGSSDIPRPFNFLQPPHLCISLGVISFRNKALSHSRDLSLCFWLTCLLYSLGVWRGNNSVRVNYLIITEIKWLTDLLHEAKTFLETNTFPAIEEFSWLLWYLNIYYRVLVLKLNHINQVYTSTHFLNIQFNSIRPSTSSSPKWLKKFGFLDGNTCIFHIPCEGYKLRPSRPPQFDHTNSIW